MTRTAAIVRGLCLGALVWVNYGLEVTARGWYHCYECVEHCPIKNAFCCDGPQQYGHQECFASTGGCTVSPGQNCKDSA